MLISWNSQGKNPTSYILANEQGFTGQYKVKPDFICIQEAGGWQPHINGNDIPCLWNPLPSYGYYNQLKRVTINTENYIGYMVPWQASLKGNDRCTLVILWRESLGTYTDFVIQGWHDGHDTHRPVFWISTSSGSLGCIHAPSGGGPTTYQYILGAIAQLNYYAPASNWIMAGDFNYPAATMKSNLPVGVSLIDTGETTQKSGGNIDYLLHSHINQTYSTAAAADYYVQSDHLQVRFI
ncbi:endonuclease/exonuclease/phosphatase family protein [Spirosoma utsteinense]|uniref:Endonuclease/exonuclease/phosphatase domain-containing protein n=1 Tax=Spirosoma utsteinense TaxID=2585773 RepID=A0ABR6W8V6_9BACT|nr:endonuclease/exonuclease/phosphatase family protein [Spirosoma utsteinense]MBC3787326.1 hypothetical protein [Spirosoma utsteinense]MBC3793012.1 hypothetical protein [Spirosoma utsteinense]